MPARSGARRNPIGIDGLKRFSLDQHVAETRAAACRYLVSTIGRSAWKRFHFGGLDRLGIPALD
jgi:hypothetical protein